MQFDKQQIIDLIKNRGDHQQAQQADQELPDKVDTDQHSGLLSKFGVDVKDLPGVGGIAGKLGL